MPVAARRRRAPVHTQPAARIVDPPQGPRAEERWQAGVVVSPQVDSQLPSGKVGPAAADFPVRRSAALGMPAHFDRYGNGARREALPHRRERNSQCACAAGRELHRVLERPAGDRNPGCIVQRCLEVIADFQHERPIPYRDRRRNHRGPAAHAGGQIAFDDLPRCDDVQLDGLKPARRYGTAAESGVAVADGFNYQKHGGAAGFCRDERDDRPVIRVRDCALARRALNVFDARNAGVRHVKRSGFVHQHACRAAHLDFRATHLQFDVPGLLCRRCDNRPRCIHRRCAAHCNGLTIQPRRLHGAVHRQFDTQLTLDRRLDMQHLPARLAPPCIAHICLLQLQLVPRARRTRSQHEQVFTERRLYAENARDYRREKPRVDFERPRAGLLPERAIIRIRALGHGLKRRPERVYAAGGARSPQTVAGAAAVGIVMTAHERPGVVEQLERAVGRHAHVVEVLADVAQRRVISQRVAQSAPRPGVLVTRRRPRAQHAIQLGRGPGATFRVPQIFAELPGDALGERRVALRKIRVIRERIPPPILPVAIAQRRRHLAAGPQRCPRQRRRDHRAPAGMALRVVPRVRIAGHQAIAVGIRCGQSVLQCPPCRRPQCPQKRRVARPAPVRPHLLDIRKIGRGAAVVQRKRRRKAALPPLHILSAREQVQCARDLVVQPGGIQSVVSGGNVAIRRISETVDEAGILEQADGAGCGAVHDRVEAHVRRL